MSLDLNKYNNSGWGLSREAFTLLAGYIQKNKHHKSNVVEFGSGISTQFFCDLYSLGSNLEIWSFDHDATYAFKGSSPCLRLYILPLLQATNKDYEDMFLAGSYDRSKMIPLADIASFNRLQNTSNIFYDVTADQLPSTIDVLVLDGPHGNGRSFAWLHCKDRLKAGSLILIDDNTHYDFEDRLLKVLPCTKIMTHKEGKKTFAAYSCL